MILKAQPKKDLEKISKERLLALTINEMESIQKYYSDPSVLKIREKKGISVKATDVELEMIAQTWKVNTASIRYFQQILNIKILKQGKRKG